MMATDKKPFHVTVAENLIEQLKAGTAPWQKPWDPGVQGFMPANPTTGKRYKGVNAVHLMAQGYSDNRWMTYKQAKAVDAQVRKGEKGTPVQYWKFSEEQNQLDSDGQPVLDKAGKPVKENVKLERPRVFFATVFNAEQMDGMPPLEQKERTWGAVEKAEHILQVSGADIRHTKNDNAFYRPTTDSIHLPDKGAFATAEQYYATALHELGHWTGHSSRLNRDLSHPFGSEGYAREELRAEISSLILGDELGIGHDPEQHAAYVGSWIQVLQDDPLEIFRASADAEKICGYVLALEHKQVIEQSQDQIQSLESELGTVAKVRQLANDNTVETGSDFNNLNNTVLAAKGMRTATFNANDTQPQAVVDKQQQEVSESSQQKRIYINVPYQEKEEAKGLGARWDRQERSWFIPPGINKASFAKWSKSEGMQTHRVEQRQYLSVPYGERSVAKAAGARWDKAAKSWYVGPQADLERLNRWLPDKVGGQQDPAMSPREEFAVALKLVGCVISNTHPVMDGQKQRVEVEGDKPGERSGFYVGHLDGHPAGYIANNRTGVNMKWKSKGYSLDPAEKVELQVAAARKLSARAAELEQQQEATAKRVRQQVADLVPVSKPTSYMRDKGIQSYSGILTDAEGKKTYIPAHDVNGKQWTMQYIREDGTKRFAKNSRKEGCFHIVGGDMQALTDAPALVIQEGYATAATNTEALNFATVAAFDSGNLLSVARALHDKFPEKPVVIFGDDDRHQEFTQGTNPGKTKAQEAAKAVGGKAVFPVFTPGERNYPIDLAPVTPQSYRDHLEATKALETAPEERKFALQKMLLNLKQLAALDNMKRYTDFNDLATKSRLGREGVERQVKRAVSKVVEEVKHQQKQKQVEKQEYKKKRAARIG